MSSARAHRSALLTLALCGLAITSCRRASEPPPADPSKTDTVVSTVPPFKTKEPERYSATRIITVVAANGDTAITKTLIAKDGPRRREEPQTTGMRLVYLDLPEGRFVLYPDEKVYAMATPEEASSDPSEPEENSADSLLHTDPISTTYQSLGTENVAGRSSAKYRVVVNNPARGNVTQNETLIWIDDSLSMPIKSETKSPDGMRTVVELTDVALDPDKQLFRIPDGYEKIVFSTLQKQLRARRLNP